MKKYKKIIIGLILALICAILPFVGVAKVKADDTIQINTIYEAPINLYFDIFKSANLKETFKIEPGEIDVIFELEASLEDVVAYMTLKVSASDGELYLIIDFIDVEGNVFQSFLIYGESITTNDYIWTENFLSEIDTINGYWLASPLLKHFVLINNVDFISFEPFPKNLPKSSIFNTIILKISDYLVGLFNVIGLTFSSSISIFYKNNELTFIGEVIAWTSGVGLVAIAIYVIYRLIKNSALKLKSGVKVNKDD